MWCALCNYVDEPPLTLLLYFQKLDEKELVEMFGEDLLDQETNDTFLRRDCVLLKLNFCLESGSFTLREKVSQQADDKHGGIATLQFLSVNVSSEWRPRLALTLFRRGLERVEFEKRIVQ